MEGRMGTAWPFPGGFTPANAPAIWVCVQAHPASPQPFRGAWSCRLLYDAASLATSGCTVAPCCPEALGLQAPHQLGHSPLPLPRS